MDSRRDRSARDGLGDDGTDAVEFTRGLRLAAIALASAVATATVVIGVGGVWLDRSAHGASTAEPAPSAVQVSLVRAAG